MIKEIFSKSENFKQEYSCKVIRMGEMKPIEGSDFLAQTIVDGYSMVVRKDEFKEGDVLFYATMESELNENFVANNNLFDIESYEKNANAKEVAEVIEKEGKDAAKRMVGFFNKYGRVRMVRLKGCPSQGFLFGLNTMVKWKKSLEGINLEDYLDVEFDTIDGELFLKQWLPRISQNNHHSGTGKGRTRKMKKLEGTYKVTDDFHRHYDTNPLQKNMHCIKPNDVVTISVKVHGTSVIIGNQRVIRYRAYSLKEKYYNRMVDKEYRSMRRRFLRERGFTLDMFRKHRKVIMGKRMQQPYDTLHRVVYSSRNAIRNKEFGRVIVDNFYEYDMYEEYGKMLGEYIPEGWTIYGEIFGYVTGDNFKYIQGSGKDGYDYGCDPGKNKMMPYRITVLDEENDKLKELNVSEVKAWTDKLLKSHPELKKRIAPINILYHGTLKNLYPQVDVTGHWSENVLELIKTDKEHFGMEMDEPMCKNKVAREGLVVRIDDDLVSEAFKCKCVKFSDWEEKKIDKGIVDVEMLEANY